MIKVSYYQGYDEEVGPRVIPLFSPADAVFEKVAAPGLLPDVLKYIETLKPENGCQYVLVNAMAAGEYFGSNINSDYFSEQSLTHAPDGWTGDPIFDKEISKKWTYGYPTFYNAGAFAHHKNQKADRAFGSVEYAGWNPRMKRVELVVKVVEEKCKKFGGESVWTKLSNGQFVDVSMGTRVPFDLCFVAGTLVRTSQGHKPIEEITTSDSVLSHTGQYRRVTETILSESTEGTIEVSVGGLPNVTSTPNHPYYVIRGEALRSCNGSANGIKRRHAIGHDGVCTFCKRTVQALAQWVQLKDVHVGDYVASSIETGAAEEQPSFGMARLLGYYLGDGYIMKQRRGRAKDGEYYDVGVGISVGTHEVDHLANIEQTVLQVHGKLPKVYSAGCGRKAHIVSIYNQQLADKLQQLGGRTSRGKYLAPEVFGWSDADKLELVVGYLDTDGSYDVKKRSIRIASVNQGLLLDVMRLLSSIGVTSTVCFGGTSSDEEGGFGTTKYWYLCIGASQSSKFEGISTKVPVGTKSRWASSKTFVLNGHVWHPVTKLKHTDSIVPTYNLSVDVDESYVANGYVVHNCSICTDWSLYREAESTFDPMLHPHVGIAVLQFHKKLIAKYGEGHGIRGLAPTRKFYCAHMRPTKEGGMPGKILPDGRKVFVFNPHPRFFDISFVFIGADKTAKVMIKIADSNRVYSFNLPGAELADSLGYIDTDDDYSKVAGVWMPKESMLGKSSGNKKAEIVKDVMTDQLAAKAIPVLNRNEESIPNCVLDAMSQRGLAPSLATATSLGMVLRPTEFQRLMLKSLGEDDLADDMDAKGSVFPKVDDSKELPFEAKDTNPLLARLLAPLMGNRSAYGPHINGRIIVVSLDRGDSKKQTTSQDSPLLRKIASAYNGYRSSLMTMLPEAQSVVASEGMPGDIAKVAEVPLEELFTPLSYRYLKDAFWDELKTAQACAAVERGSPSRNTGANQNVSRRIS